MLKKYIKKKSIKTRILKSILTMIGLTILGIAIFFNLLVNKYIEVTSINKLREAEEIILNSEESFHLGKHGGEGGEKNKFNIFGGVFQENVRRLKYKLDSQVMILSSDYQLKFPNENFDFYDEDDNFSDLYEKVILESKNGSIDLSSNKDDKVTIENDKYYYISHKKIINPNTEEYYYLIFYVDISDIFMFSNQINNGLMMIMCIASIAAICIAIILSNKIARPIQKLCKFARELGEGKFNKCEFEFLDREVDELVKVMNKSAEELDKYDKDQKVFFQNVSHELRTPLMSIKGYAEAIKFNVLDKESASEVILDESDRLIELIEELLYISKMDNITNDYVLVEHDLREILSNCTVKQKARAINMNVEFKYDFDEDVLLFKCDEKSMYRAFLNIIENALRYAKKEIWITCKKINEKIIIFIENDGEHIREEDLQYIFERFYKGKGGKNGIGLSIVKSVINKHNGEIHAYNTRSGVRFEIVLNI